ncbi:MAG: pyridoxal phosphate-dependent aminotransferase [Saprospiraceae bacterium]
MTEFKLSERVKHLNESATLRMAQKARELASKSIDVINLSLGEPDFDTPQLIKEKAKEALDQGITKYTPVAGSLALREAISQKFKRDNDLQYSVDEIIVSNGAKQSFANLCNAMLTTELDEVVLFTPYWVSYYEIIRLAGGKVVVANSTVENNYKPSLKEIKRCLNSNTRMLVFSSPCNPTGTVFTKEDCIALSKLLGEFPNVLVAADEIYEYIIFDHQHFSIGSIPEMRNRTATINGFSKGFSMTGWRLGYMGAPKEITQACIKIQGQFTSGAASFTQAAGAYALNSDLASTHAMCAAFKKRRDVLIREIKSIKQWTVNIPDGAFYLLPNVSQSFGKKHTSGIITNAEDLAIYLLNESHVAMVSGDAFGAPECLRISYSLSEEKIIEAVKRIKLALEKLS